MQEHGALPVPMKLRNAVTKLMKGEGYGEGYRYAHDEEGVGEDVPPRSWWGSGTMSRRSAGEEGELSRRLAAILEARCRAAHRNT